LTTGELSKLLGEKSSLQLMIKTEAIALILIGFEMETQCGLHTGNRQQKYFLIKIQLF